jgi:IclR family pca regulon transcriptional regulator
MARIAQVRARGHCLIDQEVELGLRSIAVPVRDSHDRVVAALNLGSPLGPEDLAEAYLPELLKVQAGLKRVLK